MGKIHDALQRAEQARRGAETLDVPIAELPVAVSHAPVATEPVARLRSWSLRRKPKAPRLAAHQHADQVVVPTNSGSPYSEEYRTLRARIQSLRRTRELRAIVVSSSRPGEGRVRARELRLPGRRRSAYAARAEGVSGWTRRPGRGAGR